MKQRIVTVVIGDNCLDAVQEVFLYSGPSRLASRASRTAATTRTSPVSDGFA